jgi:hypothetical protein
MELPGKGLEDDRSRVRLSVVCFTLMALAVPLAYGLYTNEIWEDFFITFRFSRNLCEGKGLVYNIGERVHGFTSPLGVLLPALTYWLTGKSSYVAALWAFRIISIAAFAGGCWWLMRAFVDDRWRLAPGAIGLLYCLDAKSVAFTSNGMETGLLLFFLCWAIFLLRQDRNDLWLARGFCWAGLQWIRPDGCVYVACLGLGELVFTRHGKRQRLLSFVASALVCMLAYAPWLIWASSYYGSPLPQTAFAKSPGRWVHYLVETLRYALPIFSHRAAQIYSPIYAQYYPGWPAEIGLASFVLCLAACVYWLIPSRDQFGRAMSLALFMLMAYAMTLELFYPWYIPPFTVCASVILVSAASQVTTAGRETRGAIRELIGLVLAAQAVGMALILGATMWQMRVQQEDIELGNRQRIGQWLKEKVFPGERVFVEPLGYIGFFSDARMLDWPGLVSPEVSRLKHARYSMSQIPSLLRPEWVVARPDEEKQMEQVPHFLDNYVQVAIFDAQPSIARRSFLPGRSWLLHDATFVVLRLKARGN